MTRPPGASFADYFGRARSLSGAGFGSGRVALIVAVTVVIGVVYLAITRRDVQPPVPAAPRAASEGFRQARAGRLLIFPWVSTGHGQD